ncbi:hypothetical protein BDV34DRAFT_205276 [Aspergillus parasiticus]|uniref:Uncharacterized protein n=1 Tax=Aspergillus parasiticus TaxID=5067 RepID=A0A5N6D5L9_ASPPA|nr:hypothetical protein BDV34DRAFT_205276 [Aspergillus parasiticus]
MTCTALEPWKLGVFSTLSKFRRAYAFPIRSFSASCESTEWGKKNWVQRDLQPEDAAGARRPPDQLGPVPTLNFLIFFYTLPCGIIDFPVGCWRMRGSFLLVRRSTRHAL